ncbi:MAG: PmoA family protein [Sedimentisphaerales bacterium]|nr:PmoA family protein [Sedimentisphaerales bacterium]
MPKLRYDWRQTDSSLVLLNNGRVVWQFNFDKKQGKPYFHPVCLTDGTELTWHRPPDHPWHYGLWFSWKYINGLNYWEEDRKTGLSEGRTEIKNVEVIAHDDYSAQIAMQLSYHPPDQPAVLTESCNIHVGKPDEDGRYYIDWSSRFTAGAVDVLLDRTPIPGEQGGQSWGDYAGLSVRIAKDTSDWYLIDSEGRKDLQAHGKEARWMNFGGRAAGSKDFSIAIFDHPDNLRSRYTSGSPGFVIMDPKVPFGYFSPAVLFNKPYTLPGRQSFSLKYRILIQPGRAEKNLLEAEWESFTETVGIQARTVPAQDSNARRRANDAVFKELDKTSHVFEFTPNMTFAEAIEQIKHCVDPPLPIAVIWKDLYDNADIDRTTPINMDAISGVSPGTVLKLLLASVSGGYDRLGYIIEDGIIMIATVESLPEQFETRVYDISDLL